MQGRMIGVLLGGHPLQGQDPLGWYLARARRAQAIARDWGHWGDVYFRRAKLWYGHLQRHHYGPCMASVVLKYHGPAWLEEQRKNS
eukprot:10887517-Karenia_brevis.AAC.1